MKINYLMESGEKGHHQHFGKKWHLKKIRHNDFFLVFCNRFVHSPGNQNQKKSHSIRTIILAVRKKNSVGKAPIWD